MLQNDKVDHFGKNISKIEGDPLYDPNRHAMLMKVEWDENDRPVFAYRRQG